MNLYVPSSEKLWLNEFAFVICLGKIWVFHELFIFNSSYLYSRLSVLYHVRNISLSHIRENITFDEFMELQLVGCVIVIEDGVETLKSIYFHVIIQPLAFNILT